MMNLFENLQLMKEADDRNISKAAEILVNMIDAYYDGDIEYLTDVEMDMIGQIIEDMEKNNIDLFDEDQVSEYLNNNPKILSGVLHSTVAKTYDMNNNDNNNDNDNDNNNNNNNNINDKTFKEFYTNVEKIFKQLKFSISDDYKFWKKFNLNSYPGYEHINSNTIKFSNYDDFSNELIKYINFGFKKESKEQSGLTTVEYNYNYEGTVDEVVKDGRMAKYIKIIDNYIVELFAKANDYTLHASVLMKNNK